jgi:hypothetical protein
VKSCATCTHSAFATTRNGKRIDRKWAGRCGYVVPLPAIPSCVTLSTQRIAIWHDDGKDCPVHNPITPQ